METPSEKPTQPGAQSPVGEEQCHRVVVIALAYAHRNGLRGEDGEDQAGDFLLHVLLYLRDHPQADLAIVLSSAWLARSADNWIRSYLRVQRRREYRELAWPPVTIGSGEEMISREFPSNDPLPCTEAIRAEFCQRVRDAIARAQFTDAQYELLALVLEGERVVDIATLLQRPPEAIRQRLRTLRIRLRKVLQECGLEAVEIQEYLSIIGL